ncbi:MAG: hypothetical protein COB49_04830 [Alphaproteobacteria bacterium]|nr:MAG: hypothetical protein COB49_04830 [Alphaproteobacteria bacterium]
MSEIDGPSNIPLHTGEGATRVTRTSTTSDDSSTGQQSTDKKANTPEKAVEGTERPAAHETAVTLATSLSNLEAGNRITANYQGIDAQNRPLIRSETGTYVVKSDIVHQQDIDKIPQGATLEIKILKVEREIEARLVYRDPAPAKTTLTPLSIPVTLELTGLGNMPPKIRVTAGPDGLPLDEQQIPYRAAALYRAEHIARESASKLKELPLPATTTNYTLYEKAVPPQGRPAIIRSSIAGNAFIAQEQSAKPAQAPNTENIKTTASPLTTDVAKLLHKNTLATVIKNIPKAAVDLPEIVRQHLGPTAPLDNLKAGSNFTLRINSIAIPHIQTIAAGTPAIQPERTTSPVSQSQKPLATPEFSGIIIAPGQHILNHTHKTGTTDTHRPPPANRQYPNRYDASSFTRPQRESTLITLYVATPVSVIKFQSPIELKPGTVINFSLPEQSDDSKKPELPVSHPAAQKTAAKPPPDVITTRPAQESQATEWTATSLLTRPTLPLELPPQPLEDFTRNWQSLSQILSVLPVADNSNMPQTLNNRLPGVQNSGQMTSAMIFFLAAMGAKSPARIWLGPEITQQLEKSGQGKLLTMLDNDMQRIFRLGAETPVNEWRPALIPLQIGGDVNAIPILTRQVPGEDSKGKNTADEDEDDEKISATRFIVELDLSRIGPLQVDGLLKEKRLNIIIRSKIILPPQMQQKMISMFTAALEISGYNGDLQFRNHMQPDISVRDIINQKIHMARS